MDVFPPLSLSTYWTNGGNGQACLVDLPATRTTGAGSTTAFISAAKSVNDEKEDIPLLALPELAYLNVNSDDTEGPRVDGVDFPSDMLADANSNSSNDNNGTNAGSGNGMRDPHESAAMAANLADHDPLGVIQKLFDVTECLALAIPPSDRHVLLSVGLTIGMKAGRAALLLGAASVLASSESVLNDTDIDIKVLKDIKTFVANKKKMKNQMEKEESNEVKKEKDSSKKSSKSDSMDIDAKQQNSDIQAKVVNQSNKNEAYNLLKESILRYD
jgi:hypothetical protein